MVPPFPHQKGSGMFFLNKIVNFWFWGTKFFGKEYRIDRTSSRFSADVIAFSDTNPQLQFHKYRIFGCLIVKSLAILVQWNPIITKWDFFFFLWGDGRWIHFLPVLSFFTSKKAKNKANETFFWFCCVCLLLFSFCSYLVLMN